MPKLKLIDQLKQNNVPRLSDTDNDFMKLAPDTQKEINTYLPRKDLLSLAKSSTGLFSRCTDDLTKANATLMEKLTQSVIDDDEQGIKNILNAHPDLLALDR